MRRSREADITDVLNKIIRRIRDSELAKKLGQKVLDYYRSKDPKKDLSLSESRLIYRDDDYGDTRSLSKKREVDIGWTDHAEYRSDLRDIDRKDVNQTIVERLRNKLRKPDSKKIKFKEPGVGTMVVDYDLRKDPAQADVVTVWAADHTGRNLILTNQTNQRKGTMDNQKIATELVDMAERIAHEVVKVSAPKGKTQIALLNYMRDNIGTGLEIGLTDIPYRDVPDHLNNIMNAALALSKQGLLALDYGDGDELTIKLTRKGAI